MENRKYIVFLGDSFSWGQGLYLPYWVDKKPDALRKLPEDIQWVHQEKFVDEEDLKIKDELSFTGIVSKQLGRECVKRVGNGGNNLVNLSIVSSDSMLSVDGKLTPQFSFKNKDIILIFQFTHFGRNDILQYMTEDEREEILKLDIRDSREAINRLFRNRVKAHFDYIDSKLETYSKGMGFEYWYMDWLGDFCEFRPDKFIDIKVGSNSRKYFSALVDGYDIKFNFEGRHMRDGHLNVEANKMIAESILEWLRDKSRGAGG